MTQVLDCLIIGASAAGLATAACLKDSGQTFEILEASDVVGQAWRHHYERLHLHTPKSLSSLPGLAMPSEWPRYPDRDQIVDYLERYRAHHRLEPRFGQKVTRLERRDDNWLATTVDDEWCARNVVIATGANRQPIRPTWPGLDSFRGQVMHSSEYRNGVPWKGKSVLVVGFGNSACEQAIDLVERGAQAHLAVRSPVNVIPRDIFGVVPVLQLGIVMQHLPPAVADALAWPMIRATIGDIRKVGLRKLPYGPNTQISKDRHIPLLDIGTMEHIRAGRIHIHPNIQRFTPECVVFTEARTWPSRPWFSQPGTAPHWTRSSCSGARCATSTESHSGPGVRPLYRGSTSAVSSSPLQGCCGRSGLRHAGSPRPSHAPH